MSTSNVPSTSVTLREYLVERPDRFFSMQAALGDPATQFLITDPYFETRPDLLHEAIRVWLDNKFPEAFLDWGLVERDWLSDTTTPSTKSTVAQVALWVHRNGLCGPDGLRLTLEHADRARFDLILGSRWLMQHAQMREDIVDLLRGCGAQGATLRDVIEALPARFLGGLSDALRSLHQDGLVVTTDRERGGLTVYVAEKRAEGDS